ncbi:MAG: phage holin family protein [Candidatus Promineifilaceae bacterium]
MSNTVERFAIWTLRTVISIVVNAFVLLITAWILPNMAFIETDLGSPWLQAVAAAILIGLINMLLRPVVLWISRPLGFFLLFLVGLLLNMAAIWLASWLLPGFQISGFLTILLAGIFVAAFNVLAASLVNLGDTDSYYRQRTKNKAAAEPSPNQDKEGRNLVMVEIDGLSYYHLREALDRGLLPTMQEMIKEEGYVLSKVDCGIPSQTSACQAGIMFGDNYDIPAFRWYDKTQGKLIVSSSDAGELNGRYAMGEGLMRGGTSVSNMLNGDAYTSLMTASDLREADDDEAKRRANDVYLLMLDPSFLLSVIARYLGMVVVELWEGWQQRRHDVYPRLNRLAHFYPFVRAATSIFLRELGAAFTTMDIVRGSPSIYVTWPGFDEVAHHSGPYTSDAFRELGRYDKVLRYLRRAVKEDAPVYYDMLVLSDHGQSFGPTFEQRYGVSLKEFIEQQLPAGTSVSMSMGGDTGAMGLSQASAEFANAQHVGSSGSRAADTMTKQGRQLAERISEEDRARIAAESTEAEVTAYGSGNLAQVYFNFFDRKIKLNELEAAYPGLVDALVNHEGIGLVCGYDDEGTPIAMGKTGTRNLHTEEIEGEDPLLIYAPAAGPGAASVEKRAWQVRRVMDFPHAGDLMVISTVYEDGTVAALEELIGNHGGLGGEQTDAFIFHPPDLAVPETRNSIDVFHILNEHRGKPLPPPKPEPEVEVTNDWKLDNLLKGLGMVRTWLEHVFRCLIPDREAFRGVVADPLMTGPALLVGILGIAAYTLVVEEVAVSYAIAIPLRVVMFFVSIIVVYGAGYLLTRKGSFARTTRAIGFAQSPVVLLIFAAYDPLAHIVVLIVTGLTLIGVWMGAAEAHETSGWKTAVLPIIYVLLYVVGAAAVAVVLGGASITIASVLESLGILPPDIALTPPQL